MTLKPDMRELARKAREAAEFYEGKPGLTGAPAIIDLYRAVARLYDEVAALRADGRTGVFMIDVAKLKAERARIENWQRANLSKLGTAEYRKSTLAHRLLTDLIELGAGNTSARAYALRVLVAIENGEHFPALAA